MRTQQATRIINAPIGRMREVLLDVEQLPRWNPAFWSVKAALPDELGAEHAIVVRPGLRGTWRYTRIDDHRIDAVWQVPGFVETGTWLLEPHGSTATTVAHTFGHEGPLARLLANAYQGVAQLRLDRLATRVGLGRDDQLGDTQPVPEAPAR